MEDRIDLRSALVVPHEGSNDVSNKLTVQIEVKHSLPILAGELTDSIIDSSNVMKESVYNTPPLNDPFTVLFDTVDENRYKFLGKAISVISKLKVDIYLDAKYGDILIIPELLTFGTGDNLKLYKNQNRIISGYSVGHPNVAGSLYRDTTLPLDTDARSSIIDVNRFTTVKTVLNSTYGLERNSMYSSLSHRDAISSSKTERGSLLQFLVFEDNTTLFTETVKLNVCTLLQEKHGNVVVDPVGKHEINKIVIPLNF